jgi:hypothetical protein
VTVIELIEQFWRRLRLVWDTEVGSPNPNTVIVGITIASIITTLDSGWFVEYGELFDACFLSRPRPNFWKFLERRETFVNFTRVSK